MLKIILADNQAIFRTGAAKVLAVEDDLRIVAQAESAEKAMMALEKFHATVMIFGSDTLGSLPEVGAPGPRVLSPLPTGGAAVRRRSRQRGFHPMGSLCDAPQVGKQARSGPPLAEEEARLEINEDCPSL